MGGEKRRGEEKGPDIYMYVRTGHELSETIKSRHGLPNQ